MPEARVARRHSIVALISARGGGDWPSVVALALGLHDRGHVVSLVCDRSTEAAVRSTGVPTICVPPALEQGDIRMAIARSPEIGPETPNPLVEWAQACAPPMRAHIQPRRPIVLLGSLLCMGLADQLASDLGIPWCFVNPSFYFGEDSGRPWDVDRTLDAGLGRLAHIRLAAGGLVAGHLPRQLPVGPRRRTCAPDHSRADPYSCGKQTRLRADTEPPRDRRIVAKSVRSLKESTHRQSHINPPDPQLEVQGSAGSWGSVCSVHWGSRSMSHDRVLLSGVVRLRSFSPWSSALHQGRSALAFCRSTSVPDVAAFHRIP